MEIEKLIRTRRTVHRFNTEKVSSKIVHRALELGLFAPNHKHTHPWRFAILTSMHREEIGALAVEYKREKAKNPLSESMQTQIHSKFTTPSHLVVLGQKLASDEFTRKEDYAALACAVQNISLYLWSEGVSSKWSTGAVTRDPALYAMTGWSAEDVSLEGFLWIGYAYNVPPTPPKPNLSDVLKKPHS